MERPKAQKVAVVTVQSEAEVQELKERQSDTSTISTLKCFHVFPRIVNESIVRLAHAHLRSK